MTSSPPQENAWPIQAFSFFWLEWVGCGPRSSPRVIRSETPRRSVASRTAYARSRGNPGDVCWQMLFQAFQQRNSSEIENFLPLPWVRLVRHQFFTNILQHSQRPLHSDLAA